MEQDVRQWAYAHRFKLLGAVVGLIFAVMVMYLGIFWTAFTLICVSFGAWVGHMLENEPDSLKRIVESILPPGFGS